MTTQGSSRKISTHKMAIGMAFGVIFVIVASYSAWRMAFPEGTLVEQSEGSVAQEKVETKKAAETSSDSVDESTRSGQQGSAYKIAKSSYGGETYSFEYSSVGWRELPVIPADYSPSVQIVTDDYSEPRAIAPESGAEITISVRDKSKTEEFRRPTIEDAAGISDIQTLEVAGRTAYFYRVAYEGIRYVVQMQSDKAYYTITLTGAGESTRAQKDVFNHVWQTFSIQ